MKTRIGPASMVLFAFLPLACTSAKRGEPEKRAFAPSNESLALGQRVFNAQCSYCHPGGAAGLGPPLNNKPAPAFAIRYQVRHGLGAMPAFDSTQIPERELRAVADYLTALRRSD